MTMMNDPDQTCGLNDNFLTLHRLPFKEFQIEMSVDFQTELPCPQGAHIQGLQVGGFHLQCHQRLLGWDRSKSVLFSKIL